MLIRVGYDILFDVPAPSPMVLMLYLHPSRLQRPAPARSLRIEPDVPVDVFTDIFGNPCGRIVAAGGHAPLHQRRRRPRQRRARPDSRRAAQHHVEDLPTDVLLFLLASRYCEVDRLTRHRLGALRPARRRLAARAGDLRLRPPAHPLRLHATPAPPRTALESIDERRRRLPRLHAPGDHVLPLPEHPRPLLHRLPRRHRRPAAALTRWTSAPGSRSTSAAAGGRLRRPQQRPPHRPRPDGPRPRRRRRRPDHDFGNTQLKRSRSGRTK